MFKTILLPMDLSHDGSHAQARSGAVAHIRCFGGCLYLLTVVPRIDLGSTAVQFPGNYGEQLRQEARQRLEAFAAELPADITAGLEVRHGVVYKEILNVAQEFGADLIIMGSHRPELSDYLLGPNSARVVRHARCSVLVVRG